MNSNYVLCQTCNFRIEQIDFSNHNCVYEKKVRDLEGQLNHIIEDNKRLRTQNEELKTSVLTIKKEIGDSFVQVKGILDNLKVSVEKGTTQG
jgi:hypothetical protein